MDRLRTDDRNFHPHTLLLYRGTSFLTPIIPIRLNSRLTRIDWSGRFSGLFTGIGHPEIDTNANQDHRKITRDRRVGTH